MSSSNDEGASKSNDDGVCEVNDMLQNLSTDDKEVIVSICANCGKEGSDVNNRCNKCKKVKYCNAAFKKKHRHKHKKDCEEHIRQAAEHNAKLHDKELFKQPPLKEDCPICFLVLPLNPTGSRYMSCCGKTVCSGCCHAPLYDNQGNKVDNKKCPFCRTRAPTSDEELATSKRKRVEKDDPIAIYNQGVSYAKGSHGFPQDYKKALELWHRAAELGFTRAFCNIGCAYEYGRGVEVDKKKALHYTELGAMVGDAAARGNLGLLELILVMRQRTVVLVTHMILVMGWKSTRRRHIIIMS